MKCVTQRHRGTRQSVSTSGATGNIICQLLRSYGQCVLVHYNNWGFFSHSIFLDGSSEHDAHESIFLNDLNHSKLNPNCMGVWIIEPNDVKVSEKYLYSHNNKTILIKEKKYQLKLQHFMIIFWPMSRVKQRHFYPPPPLQFRSI